MHKMIMTIHTTTAAIMPIMDLGICSLGVVGRGLLLLFSPFCNRATNSFSVVACEVTASVVLVVVVNLVVLGIVGFLVVVCLVVVLGVVGSNTLTL